MQLTELLSVLPFYRATKPIENIVINGLKMDNREIEQDDVFICIKGFTVDGHDFAHQAVKSGAKVVVSERELEISNAITIIVPDTMRALSLLAAHFYQFPTKDFPLIGITGTNGKTTITYILETIFNEHKQKTGLIGTIQLKIGDESYPIKNTTPDALSLQKIFKQMKDEQIDVCMMEVSSHALHLGRVHGTEFDIGVFTNLSQDHLDYHKTMEDYLHAKTLLFSQLGNNYDGKKKYAIINIDDKVSSTVMASTAQHILTFSCETDADVYATEIKLLMTGSNFTLHTPLGEVKIKSQLIGKFNVSNMLAAVTVAIAMEVPLLTIKHALESISGVAGRFEQVQAGQNFATIVDYAHTPDSLQNVLETIAEFKQNKVYVVVGTGGDRDRTKRPLMAQVALDYADKVIFTSDNPRTEDPQDILNDMTQSLTDSHFEVIIDRQEAIDRAVQLAEDGDTILIAGKGHETYQEVNGKRYDFDDCKVAEQAILNKE